MRVQDPAGVRYSLGGPGPPAVLAEGYLLRDTWRHRTLPKRGAGPGPFAGRVGLRTTGVRPLSCQGVVKDNYDTLALAQQEGVPQSWGTDSFVIEKNLVVISRIIWGHTIKVYVSILY